MSKDNPLRNTHKIIVPLALLTSLLLIIGIYKSVTYREVSSLDDIPPLYPQAQWGEYQKARFLGASQYLIKRREVVSISTVSTLNNDDLYGLVTYYNDELKKRGWRKTHQVQNDKSGAGVYLFSKIAGLSPNIISRFFFYIKVYGYLLFNKPLPFQERYFKMNYEKPPYNPGMFNVGIQYTDYINHPQ